MARLLVNWGMRNGKNVFDLYKFMTGSQSERKRERERARVIPNQSI